MMTSTSRPDAAFSRSPISDLSRGILRSLSKIVEDGRKLEDLHGMLNRFFFENEIFLLFYFLASLLCSEFKKVWKIK